MHFEVSLDHPDGPDVVQLQAGAEGLDYSYSLSAGADHFVVKGNMGVLQGNQMGSIEVRPNCSSQLGHFTGVLTVLTSDPLKSTLNIPLSLDCTRPGSLSSYSLQGKTLSRAVETQSSTTLEAQLKAGAYGLGYDVEVLSGKEFISTRSGGVYMFPYAESTFPITLTCPATPGTYQGQLRLNTDDPRARTLDLNVQLKCFVPLKVKTLWSKPRNMAVNAATWNPSGTLMAVADAANPTGAVLLDRGFKMVGHTTGLSAVANHLQWINDSTLVLLSNDVVQIWDLKEGRAKTSWSHDLQPASDLQVNRTRAQIAVTGQLNDGTKVTRVYNHSGQVLATLNDLSSPRFSRDGLHLAGYHYTLSAASYVNELMIFDTATFAPETQVGLDDLFGLQAHLGAASLQWSADSKHLYALVGSSINPQRGLVTYHLDSKKAAGQNIQHMAGTPFLIEDLDHILTLSDELGRSLR